MAIRYLSGINVDNNVLFVDDANNRVGVGTGNPGAPFEVNSNGGLPIIRARYNATYYTDFDSNGIDFRGASQTFDIKDNGSSAIRIASGGNVGIGTTTPTAPLEITNTGSAGGGYTMFNASYSAAKQWGMRKYGIDNGTGIAFSSDVQFSSTWYNATRIGHGQNANNPSFQSYYTTYLATTSGNVGIGTTSPTYKLDVVGEGRTSDAFMAGGAINIDNNLAIQISSAGAGTQRWIGINKNNGYGLIIGYVENAAALSGVGAYIRQVTSDPIHFLVNNATTAMSIVSSGNVGIGTTAPQDKLTVKGATNYNLNLGLLGGYSGIYVYNDASSAYNHLRIDASPLLLNSYSGSNVAIAAGSAVTRLTIGAYSGSRLPYINGTVNTFDANGITVTSSNTANAAIGGGIDLTNNTYSVGAYSPIISFSSVSSNGSFNAAYSGIWGVLSGQGVDANWVAGHLVFGSGAGAGITERMRITGDGNVGIGTSSPSTKLEVGNFLDAVTNKITVAARYEYEPEFNFRLGQSGTNLDWIGAVISSGDDGNYNGKILFKTANAGRDTPTTKMIIKANGNVGIGTTSPSQKFVVSNGSAEVFKVYDSGEIVAGTNYIYAAASGTSFYSQGAASFRNSIYNDAAAYLQISGGTSGYTYFSGNVGIGTASPAVKLTVSEGVIRATGTTGSAGQIDASPSFGAFRFYDGSTFYGGLGMGQWSGVGANSDIVQYLSSGVNYHISNTTSPAFTLTSAGSVGIGTTSPSNKLTVIGTAAVYSAIGASDNVRTGLAHYDTTASAEGVGGQIVLGYKYTDAGDYTEGAIIKMYKESGTSGQFGSGLKFQVRNNGANLSTKAYIDPSGNFTSIGYGFFNGEGLGTSLRVGGIYSNLGLYVPSSYDMQFDLGWDGIFKFTRGNAERMRIVGSTGYVGIGTTIPGSRLQVTATSNSATTVDNGITILNDAGIDNCLAGIRLSTYGGADGGLYPKQFIGAIRDGAFGAGKGSIVFCNRDAADTSVVALSDEKMRILPSGNVGIGTTAPTYKLQVSNKTRLYNVSIGGTDGGTYDAYSDSVVGFDNLHLAAQGAGAVYINTSIARPTYINPVGGNVGIGTTAPEQKLHVEGTIQLGNTEHLAWAYDNGSYYNYITNFYDTSTGMAFRAGSWTGGNNVDFSFQTYYGGSWSTKLAIKGDGNVGIGTTAPSAELQVNKASDVTIAMSNSTAVTSGNRGNLAFYNSAVSTVALIKATAVTDNVGTQLEFYTRPAAGSLTQVLTLASTGAATFSSSVGINGVGPTYPLYVRTGTNQRARFADNGGLFQFGVLNDAESTYSDMSFGNSSLIIKAGGNVGIGTTAPNALLSISKTISSDTRFLEINNAGNNQFRSDIDFTVTSGGVTVGRISSIYPSANNVGLSFSTYGTSPSTGLHERMRINGSDGNIGIGTTGPTEKLHVDGSTLITYNNSFQSTNSVGNKAILARVSPTAGIVNYAEYATATNLNGFVIGSDDARVKGNIATDSLEFITNTSTRMTILSSGNVGINTTTPGSTLHVIGDVLIQTGSLGVGVNPNATDGRIDASNDIVAFSTSDRRLKENITPITNALEKVRSLTGVEFDWKEETKSVHGYEGHDVGVIAQDVQAVLPEAVRTNDSGYLSVRYEKMIALLVEAMKEQQAQIDELKKLIK